MTTPQTAARTPVSEPRLAGKRVVVTGAAGTIGGWIADAFARSGSRLLLCDARTAELTARYEGGRWRDAAQVEFHGGNLRDDRDIAALTARIGDVFGAPDIVVNNAGIYPHADLLDLDTDGWRAVLDVNLTAPFVLIRDAARLMIRDGVPGVFVNIASGAAVTVQPTGVAYSVSKAGLAMLTRGAALALAPHRIRVNAVAPGFAPGSTVSPLDDDYVATMAGSIPLGRTAGPDDAAAAVLFLCSDRASFITGSLVHVDGGRRAGASA